MDRPIQSKTKNKIMPILDELARRPGTRMQVFNRCQHKNWNLENWGEFKRLWDWMRFQGMIETHDVTLCSHTLTPQAREMLAESEQP